jgi:hypothetical protein
MKNLSTGIVRLSGHSVNKKPVSCTGVQLTEILRVLQDQLVDCKWLVADITSNDRRIPSEMVSSKFRLINSTEELMNISIGIDQYLSGIFLAIPKHINELNIRRVLETEDIPTIDMEDSIVEIRAFDTTYFEIYSSKIDILQTLSNSFKVTIVSSDDSIAQ